MQHRIIERHNLLDENNNIIEPGYATKLLPIYNKKTDFKSRFKTKEWDYYLIGNDHFAIAMTLDDNGYMAQDSISLLNYDERWCVTKDSMIFFTFGKKNLPPTSEVGDCGYKGKGYELSFKNDGTTRHLTGHWDNFIADTPLEFDIKLTDFPDDSMVICTPFEKPGHFYFNQKINCMHASGQIKTGNKIYDLNQYPSKGTLDWGRGIWTYKNTWYWSSLSTVVDGHDFGWNLGYGFGDTSAASENMFFYDGKASKLENVNFGIPKDEKGNDDFLSDWHFTSDDSKLDVTFKPFYDRAAKASVVIIESDQHQVFGKFYGNCTLDDGTIIKLDGQVGFAEKVKNKW